ncbi:MAG: glycoside hydrolase N-terminal domain-containing protein [Verrucomicrobia bacterium]|nr:glycoside hydrolase N-terminal domain-containing protein [Verrucomicrobiota bacterium]
MNPIRVRSLLRQQDIVYRVPVTRWDEALPLGDGCFGGMAYQEGNAFIWTINHLDVYMAFNPKDHPIPVEFKGHYQRIVRQAWAAHRKPASPEAQLYARILYPSYYTSYGWLRKGAWMNVAGQLRIQTVHSPSDAIEFEQRLNLYEAAVETRCRWKEGELRLRSFVAKNHRTLVVEMTASRPGLLERLETHRTIVPSCAAPSSGMDGGDFWLSDSLKPVAPDAPESARIGYTLYARLLDEHGRPAPQGRMRRTERSVDLRFARETRRCTLLLTAALDEAGSSSKDAARRIIVASHQQGTRALRKDHGQTWRAFWNQSQIELADKFLERLWYVNLYALACCDGTGMRFKSQATGLNGLWDVKNSSAWGSCWYWDVNIQQAYWGCYTANHLEMTQPFYDGLREYVPAARRWAVEFYRMRGIAGDYPYTFYHCIWPWCCQFLWWGYRYSMDEKFLRETAYPIMREVLQFFEDFLRRDSKGRFFAFPTVSPEQGPLGKNATILLACLRYLLEAGIEANHRLKADPQERATWQRLLRSLSPLPIGRSIEFGETILDSEWASPTLYLAHPSLLMPIYPAGCIGPDSPGRLQKIARNTLRYVENREAISTHNYGWLSAAAARLGLGDEASRILYEKGVAYTVRTNGLLAEETERWIDNCAVLSGPVYLPSMPEASGALLGAVNEMLLQSRDGKVRVFPAVPSQWPFARFEKLLAEGAWEVSAEYRHGKTRWVKITGRAGGKCRLTVNGRTFDVGLQPGEVRQFSFGGKSVQGARSRKFEPNPPCYVAPSKRRVFLGKTADTEYLRRLDDFLYNSNLGDMVIPRATKYKFDFGPAAALKKDYAAVIPQQVFNFDKAGSNKIGADFYRIHSGSLYSELRRFGWKNSRGLQAADRRRPDALRRDFVGGRGRAVFCVELPRGAYQLLFLMGDAAAPTQIGIQVRNQFRWETRRPLRAGEFAVKTFGVQQENDGVLEVHFASGGGHTWKLNSLLINRIS